MTDITSLASLSPEAFTKYNAAKVATLKKFQDLAADPTFTPTLGGDTFMHYDYASKIPGFAGDDKIAPGVLLTGWQTKFSQIEQNIIASIGLDRTQTMRDFLLTSNGYAQYYGDAGIEKLKTMGATSMMTLNGFTNTMKAAASDYFMKMSDATFNALNASVSPASVDAYERSISNSNSATLSNEILNDVCSKLVKAKKDFYQEVLGFKGVMGLTP